MKNRSTPIFPSRSQRAARVLGVAAVLCAPCLFAPATWAAEQTVVAPPQYANREGEGQLGDVFDHVRSRIRYQQVYDAPAFQAVATDIINITGIRFRMNGIASGSFDVVVPKIEIRLSTSPNDSAGLSTIFSNNVGPDLLVVYPEASLRLQGQGLGQSPNPFNVEIRFEQSFWYDPRAGHLLLEILKPGDGVLMPMFDLGFNGVGYAMGIYDSPTAALVRHPDGLVTQFIYTTVPEPQSWALGTVGVLCLMLLRRRRL
jgi:hypothetical protein